MPPLSPPALVRAYGFATRLLAPLAYRRVVARLRAHGTDPARFGERLGRATLGRPEGTLIWFHAASVGESLSVLRLIAQMGEAHPDWHFLITSGTPTSAEILSKRLPPRARHQFAPLDSPASVGRFLSHWQPSAAIFVESEIWPVLMYKTAKLHIPMALVNARISDGSARNWKRFPHTARFLMGMFRVIHTQDERTTRHLHDLGLTHAFTGQNLKSLSGPLPFDKVEFSRVSERLSGRPAWVASSTHPGEEEVVLDAHRRLLRDHPDLLLILVPRHPDRAGAITALIRARDLTFKQRSAQALPTPDTSVYLADSLGETGLWYALCPRVFLGGSLMPVGGHNPYEPVHAGAAVLHGPLYANFRQAYADLDAAGAGAEVTDAPSLALAVDELLCDPGLLDRMRKAATRFAVAQTGALDMMTRDLIAALFPGTPPSG